MLRRSLLSVVLCTPAIIRTPGILMPISAPRPPKRKRRFTVWEELSFDMSAGSTVPSPGSTVRMDSAPCFPEADGSYLVTSITELPGGATRVVARRPTALSVRMDPEGTPAWPERGFMRAELHAA